VKLPKVARPSETWKAGVTRAGGIASQYSRRSRMIGLEEHRYREPGKRERTLSRGGGAGTLLGCGHTIRFLHSLAFSPPASSRAAEAATMGQPARPTGREATAAPAPQDPRVEQAERAERAERAEPAAPLPPAT
jgi:hypothetical protein